MKYVLGFVCLLYLFLIAGDFISDQKLFLIPLSYALMAGLVFLHKIIGKYFSSQMINIAGFIAMAVFSVTLATLLLHLEIQLSPIAIYAPVVFIFVALSYLIFLQMKDVSYISCFFISFDQAALLAYLIWIAFGPDYEGIFYILAFPALATTLLLSSMMLASEMSNKTSAESIEAST